MSRQRDYQPTIDRARSQAEIAKAREAKIRAKRDECHRDMLRAQAAARIADEEADHLREQVVILESMVRDLRGERGALGRTIGSLRAELRETQAHPIRATWRRLKAWAGERWREMLSTAAEA